ncbi:MAG: ATP-binding protein, partial [Candidatus Methanomethylicota archaeon]
MAGLMEITYEYLESLKHVREVKRDFKLREYEDIFALIGPRRVGKTFTLLKKARELLDSGEQVIYVSLDEPFLRGMNVRGFAELVRKEYPDGIVYLFLDEIQEWRNWDFNLRWLHDVKDFRIYVSGSSSTLMASEIPTRLRGRYISKNLYPLSFKEIVDFEIKTFRERGRVQKLLEDYLKWGGFPEVWLTKSREKIMSLLETIFYRDIVERFRIEDVELFKQVFYFTLSNYSNLLSYRSINRMLKTININIDVKTLIKYVNYMKQAFLLFTIDIYTYSQRVKTVNPKKIYVIDTSILNLFPQKMDIGRKMENLVFIE